MTKVTFEITAARKTAIIAAFNTNLTAKTYSGSNEKKRQKFLAFFERNERALDLLAGDDANTAFIGKQLYAIEKLFDALSLASSSAATNADHKHSSIMHHFILRVLKSAAQHSAAKQKISVKLAIELAISHDSAKPHKAENAELYCKADKVRDASTIDTQAGQVRNALRVLQILKGDESEFDLSTKVAKILLKKLENYNGCEMTA